MEESQVVGTSSLPANEQRAKPVVPGVRSLHDPTPRSSAPAAPRLFASSTDVRANSTCSNLAIDVVEVVALVEAQILRPPRTSRCSHHDGVHRRDCRPLVVHIGGSDLRGQRHASSIGQDVTFDAGLASVRRIGPCCVAAFGCLDHGAIHRGPLPLDAADLIVEFDELLEQPSKDASLAPRLESRVARRTRAELRRQCLPLSASTQAVHDPRQNRATRDRRPPTPRSLRGRRKQRLYLVPQSVRDLGEFALHPPRRSRAIWRSNQWRPNRE